MKQFFCDFETYYDPEYSLSKMPTAQYIMDDRFQAIMMTWSTGGDIFVAVGDENIRKVLAMQDWANTELVSHNTGFDGNILSLRYGVIPARYADTMAMCRNTGAHMFSGASLDAVAKVLQNVGIVVPDKGTEVYNMRYKRLFKHSPSGHWYMRETPIEGNSPEHLQLLAKCADDFSKYVSYCRTDTLICMKAYHYFKKLITPDEMDFIHIMTSCWCNPIFYLDTALLEEELVRLDNRNKEELQECADRYFGGSTAKALTTFRSAKQFADMLRSMGGVTQSEAEQMMEAPLFIIPTTISERTGKEGWSFGKTSTAFIELCEAGVPEVSDLCRLKLECTSSIEKSRTERFKTLSMLRFPDGRPVPFGMPYTVSQAGTHRLGGCVVASTAVIVKNPAGDVIVKPIIAVTRRDLVWDGEQFCKHDGVVYRGEQEIIEHDGVCATLNHKCYLNDGTAHPIKWFVENGEHIMDCPVPKELEGYQLAYFRAIPGVFKVFDILNVGDKHRFWANGKLIHNSDSINVQNLPSGRKEGQSKALRRAIQAPQDWSVVVCDSSQIECVWGEGYVLTKDRGKVRIVDITNEDLIFDGNNFVSHQGLVYKGERYVIEYQGIVATPDHVVYDKSGNPTTLASAKDRKIEISTGGREGENLWGMDGVGQANRHSHIQAAEDTSMVPVFLWKGDFSSALRLAKGEEHEMFVLREMGETEVPRYTRVTVQAVKGAVQCNTGESESQQICIENLCEYREQVQRNRRLCVLRLEDAAYGLLCWIGDRQDRHEGSLREGEHSFSNTGAERPESTLQYNGDVQWAGDECQQICKRLLSSDALHDCDKLDNSLWTYIGGVYPEGRGDCFGPVKVYDIINCGPNFRFMYNGRVVSNCRANAYMSNEHWLLEVFASGGDPYSVQASQLYGGDPAEIKKRAKSGEREYEIKRSIGKVAILSAQYGVGWKSFQAMCKVQGGIDVSDDDAKYIINVYRKTNPNIVKFWDTCKYVLERMAVGAAGYFGGPNNDLFYYDGGRKVHGKTVPSIQLPDGNWLCYYNLQKKMRQYDDGSEKLNFCYWGVKERKPQTVWIYPAKLAENLCQAFAFAVMKQQALLINKWAPIRMNVHDEWGICVPKEYAKAGLDYMLACMRWAPAWAQGLPLNAEGDYSDRYGDCK